MIPGLLHKTVPTGGSSASTSTSADPLPAVIVTCPAATAVSTGGLSVDRLTTVASLVAHVSPVIGCPDAFTACIVWVSPTTIVSTFGTSVPFPPGTVNVTALLHAPFCCTRATPLSDPGATVAVICVSLQLVTWPSMLPRITVPCVQPKPVPMNVTCVPLAPDAGLMLAMC